MYPTIKHKTDIILEKLQGSQARYRKGSYRRSYCICLINLLHRLLSVDFVPRNYTNESLYRQKREKSVGERREGFDLMSNKVEQLKRSRTMSVELMNFLNYCDKLQFHSLKEMKTTSLRNQESATVCHLNRRLVINQTTCFLLSYLHSLINFPSFSNLGVIHTLSIIAFLVE